MLLPNRPGSSNEYRYGYQGQEKDDEIKGEGNSLNYKYRMHDPRLGRFFAVDPLTSEYPHYSPYSFSGNKLIHKMELEGLEETDHEFSLGSDFDFATESGTNLKVDVPTMPSTNDYNYLGGFSLYESLANKSGLSPSQLVSLAPFYFSSGKGATSLTPQALGFVGVQGQNTINGFYNLASTVHSFYSLGSPGEGLELHNNIMNTDLRTKEGISGIYNTFATAYNRSNALFYGTLGEVSVAWMGLSAGYSSLKIGPVNPRSFNLGLTGSKASYPHSIFQVTIPNGLTTRGQHSRFANKLYFNSPNSIPYRAHMSSGASNLKNHLDLYGIMFIIRERWN